MFSVQVMQDYGRSDEKFTMGVFDRAKHSLAPSASTQRTLTNKNSNLTLNGALVLDCHRTDYITFRKTKDGIKSNSYFEELRDKVVRETDRIFTLVSEKIIRNFDISINIGTQSKSRTTRLAIKISLKFLSRDARKTSELTASSELQPRRSDQNYSRSSATNDGSDNHISFDSSSDGHTTDS